MSHDSPLELAGQSYRLGQLDRAQGRAESAIDHFRRAIAIDPQFFEAYSNLGAVLSDQQRPLEALAVFQEVANRWPHVAELHFNLGNRYRALERTDEAISAYRRAMEIKPDFPSALQNLGTALQSLRRLEEAKDCYRRALALDPAFIKAEFNLAGVLQLERKLDEAQAAYEHCVSMQPDNAELHFYLGQCLQLQGKHQEAIGCYERAISLDGDYALAHYRRGTALLALGHFAEGWAEYEWRLKTVYATRPCPRPAANLKELRGQRVAVYAEWGFGDTLNFIRYVPLLEQFGAEVVVEAQPALVPLLEQSGFKQVVRFGSTIVPACDIQVPLLSLPRIFDTSLGTIPGDTPYLAANPALIQVWHERLKSFPGFKIGIHWEGSQAASSDGRTIPLREFEALTRVGDVTLVSLQQHDSTGDLAAIGKQLGILDFGDELDRAHGPFMDTAAIMKNLDLVVATDSSLVHLAGALNVPVWVALPCAPEWRFLTERDDSPWYPSMRLFRQSVWYQWGDIFQQMATALAGLVGARPGRL